MAVGGRLTWQNVAAPSFRDALVGTQMGTGMITNGFDSLAGIAGDIRARQKDAASATAISEALKFNDAGQFEKAMANGGLAGLGIDPRNLNEGALKFFADRGSELLDQDNTQLGMQNTQQQMSIAAAEEQSRIADDAFNMPKRIRDEEEDNRLSILTENARVLGLKAQTDVGTMANTALNREEVQQQIIDMKLDETTEKAYLDALVKVDEANFAVKDSTRRDFTTGNTASRETVYALDTFDVAIDTSVSTNPTLRALDTATRQYDGIADPVAKAIENLGGVLGEDGLFTQGAGSLRKDANDRVRIFNVAPELVAALMETNLKKGAAIRPGDPQNVDWDEIDKVLGEIKTGGGYAAAQAQMTDVKRQRDEVQRLRDDFQRANEKAMRLRDVDPQRYAAADKQRDAAMKAIQLYAEKNTNNVGGGEVADTLGGGGTGSAQTVQADVLRVNPDAPREERRNQMNAEADALMNAVVQRGGIPGQVSAGSPAVLDSTDAYSQKRTTQDETKIKAAANAAHAEWKSMSKAEREERGLPTSKLAAQNYFSPNKWLQQDTAARNGAEPTQIMRDAYQAYARRNQLAR